MSPEAQCIAIAKACGWKFLKNRKKYRWYNPITRQYAEAAQDYLNDLNAMHEAEKVLTRGQRVRFINELCGLVSVNWRPTSHFDSVHATAAQRAEAFLKTLGLWLNQPSNRLKSQGNALYGHSA